MKDGGKVYVLDLRLIQASLNQLGLAAVSFRHVNPRGSPMYLSKVSQVATRVGATGATPNWLDGHMFSFNEKQHLHYTGHSNDPARVASSKYTTNCYVKLETVFFLVLRDQRLDHQIQ